jgi:hypothetical protein
MPIRRLLRDNSVFGPDEIQSMADAYENSLRDLGLTNRDDPLTELVAKQIIEIARMGERDPRRMSERAIEQLGIPFTLPRRAV